MPDNPIGPDPAEPGPRRRSAREVGNTLGELFRAAAVPHEERIGPITQDYGPRADDDALHAARLREIQNLAALRARILGERTEEPLRDSDNARVSMVDVALTQSRLRAERDGVPVHDIGIAIEVGLTGKSWVQEPSHRWLGRIEQLTSELTRAHEHGNAQRDLLTTFVERIAAAESANTKLSEQLAANDTYIRDLWAQVTDAEWLLGSRVTAVDWPSTLRELTSGHDTGTDHDRASTGLAPAGELDSDIGTGREIDSAIQSAVAPDTDSNWDHEESWRPTTPPELDTGSDPEATP